MKNKDSFLPDYSPDSPTEMPLGKVGTSTESDNAQKNFSSTNELHPYMIAKPRRIIIRGKVSHD